MCSVVLLLLLLLTGGEAHAKNPPSRVRAKRGARKGGSGQRHRRNRILCEAPQLVEVTTEVLDSVIERSRALRQALRWSRQLLAEQR